LEKIKGKRIIKKTERAPTRDRPPYSPPHLKPFFLRLPSVHFFILHITLLLFISTRRSCR
jgi:hypothetical protein